MTQLLSIERILPCPGHAQQQQAAHDADVLVEVDHVGHMRVAGHGPEAVSYERRAQRVQREEKRERPGVEADHNGNADKNSMTIAMMAESVGNGAPSVAM